MQFYSQDGQDKFIAELFSNKKNGIFIDIGAYDGVNLSNTFYLEKNLYWSGICIEPNPIIFEKLNANRKATNLNCGVGETKGTFKFMAVSGSGTMLSGLVDKFDEKHLLRIEEGIRIDGGTKNLIDVPVLPLKNIFEDYNFSAIDYCNIDVEGNEIGVLRSIDFSKVQIRAFTIENNYDSKEIRDFLKPFGYKLIAKLGADEVYQLDSKRYDLMFKFTLKKGMHFLSGQKLKLKKKIGFTNRERQSL